MRLPTTRHLLLSMLGIAVLATPGCGKKKPATPAPKLFDDAAFYGKQQAVAGEKPGGPARVAPPLALTCSDGAGLQLHSLRARAVIEGPLAFTELHLRFTNPEPRTREGRFSITLPPGAAISRFAMRTGDRWMEGEVVPKQQARRIYEDYLHRKQDPALLETDAGNTFRARVFPIPPSGEKELIVSYTTELADAAAPYVLPLAGLGRLAELDATVAVQHTPSTDGPRKPEVVHVSQQGFAPTVDLVVHPSAAGGPSALRNGDLVVARVMLPKRPDRQGFGEVVILADTSASEAIDFPARVARIGELVAFVGKHGAKKVRVLAFDQGVRPVFDDLPAKWGEKQRDALLESGALGASDWGRGLAAVGELLGSQDPPAKDVRVIVVGNGVATAGQTAVDELRKAVLTLQEVGVTRLDTVEMAAQRDMDVLGALATAGLANDGLHVQLPRGGKASFEGLLAATYRPVQVAVTGAAWSWPRELTGLRGGDSALVFAEHTGGPLTVELRGGVEKTLNIQPQPAARALLHTAWVGARIRRLLHDAAFGDPDMRPMARQQALKLSVDHRVLCELTALLVLESPSEYHRYGLKQTSLADIVGVSEDLEVSALGRDKLYIATDREPKKAEAKAPKPDDSAPAGQAAAEESPTKDMVIPRPGDEDAADLETGTASPPAPDAPAMRPAKPAPAEPMAEQESDEPRLTDEQQQRKRAAREIVAEHLRTTNRRIFNSQGAVAEAKGSGATAFGGGDAGEMVAGMDAGGGGLKTGKSGFASAPLAAGAAATRKKRVGVSVTTAGLTGGTANVRIAVLKVLQRHQTSVRRCFERAARSNPTLGGRLVVRFTVDTAGRVTRAVAQGLDALTRTCVEQQYRRFRGMPRLPESAEFSQQYRFSAQLEQLPGAIAPLRDTQARERLERARKAAARERAKLAKQRKALAKQRQALEKERLALEQARLERERRERGSKELAELRAGIANSPNLRGPYAAIRHAIDSKKHKTALQHAWKWRNEDAGNAMALVALGDVFTAMEEPKQAARAYGSLIDLFPSRADLRRFAGNLLEATGGDAVDGALELALDTYRRAVEQRPDHPAGYHLLAMALANKGELADAIAVAEKGLKAQRRRGNFRGVDAILRDDIAMFRQAQTGQGAIPPNLRFILTWETDANDVDFHIFDSAFEHASFRNESLGSGGRLYADITTGYGPECFRIDEPTAYPYRLLAHYYAMGPMGYGMGRLSILRYDGKRGFGAEQRPFVIMQDRAYVDLGEVTPRSAPVLR